MIGLDTNVLLRLWLNDDPRQNARIDRLLAEHGSSPGSLLVNDVVLVEAMWTLRAAYKQDKAAQLVALHSLLDEPAFCFEDRETVVQAVAMFSEATCGFSDCLVVVKNTRAGGDFTATFDRQMLKLPGTAGV